MCRHAGSTGYEGLEFVPFPGRQRTTGSSLETYVPKRCWSRGLGSNMHLGVMGGRCTWGDRERTWRMRWYSRARCQRQRPRRRCSPTAGDGTATDPTPAAAARAAPTSRSQRRPASSPNTCRNISSRSCTHQSSISSAARAADRWQSWTFCANVCRQSARRASGGNPVSVSDLVSRCAQFFFQATAHAAGFR